MKPSSIPSSTITSYGDFYSNTSSDTQCRHQVALIPYHAKPSRSDNQSDTTFCLLDHLSNLIHRLEGDKEDDFTFASSKIPRSSTKTNSPKCFGQCHRIQAKPMLVCRLKRLALVDDRSEPIIAVLLIP
nr:hypothetical transcript [Hymenolepis microstoma]